MKIPNNRQENNQLADAMVKTSDKKISLLDWALWTLIYLVMLSFSVDGFAQQPQTPKAPSFEPVKTGHYYTTVPNHQGNTYQTPQKNIPMGATAQDVINQTNRQGPVYKPNMTPQGKTSSQYAVHSATNGK